MNSCLLKFTMVISFFLFSGLLLHSQCPDNIPPLPGPAWTEVRTVTEVEVRPGVFCPSTVVYCWRIVGVTAPIVQVYVRGGGCSDPTVPCDCWGEPPYPTPREYLSRMADAVIKNNPDNLPWPCPPCPQSIKNYQGYLACCFDQDGYFCSDPPYNTYCERSYSVCCNGTDREATFLGAEIIGPTCPDGCTSDCK